MLESKIISSLYYILYYHEEAHDDAYKLGRSQEIFQTESVG